MQAGSGLPTERRSHSALLVRSPTFHPVNGGGNFTSSDSFLRVAYINLKQTNGFLYLIGDSSVNYISGVQTSGSPPITTFTNQNADPEVGSPWPGTVDVFSRNILFANAFGVHVSYGGAVTKISDMLDGVYNTVPNFGNITPSAGKAIIFGKKCWVLLLPIIDPVKGQQVNKLFLWNGKTLWWTSEQDVPLIFINFQEINSILTCYGTNGASVWELFSQPSIAFTKTAQTKLWDKPGGYQFTKFVTRLWGIVKYYIPLSPTVNISLDNELNSTSSGRGGDAECLDLADGSQSGFDMADGSASAVDLAGRWRLGLFGVAAGCGRAAGRVDGLYHNDQCRRHGDRIDDDPGYHCREPRVIDGLQHYPVREQYAEFAAGAGQ